MENKEIKKQKETKNSNHSKFEVIPEKSKIAWDLPQSTLDYVMERFEKYIKENDISWQETWGPKTTDNYFNEMTKGSITTALRSKDQFVSKFFFETKKRCLFLYDYKFEKCKPVHFIFAIENRKPRTTLMIKIDLCRHLPHSSPASININCP